MIYYLIIILLLLGSFFEEAKLSKLKKLFIFLFITATLIIFAGLRGNIEGDYAAYLDIFKTSAKPYSTDLGIEPLYFYFNKAIIKMGLAFQVIVFSMAILSIFPKLIFISKNSPNFSYSVLIYYCTSFFIFDFIQIRQAVAIAIFMVSLRFIYEKKVYKYILTVLSACLFHVSALILIPGYYVFNIKYPKKVLYTIIGICAIINLLLITVPLVEFLLANIPLPGFSEAKIAFYAKSEDYSPVSIKQLGLGVLFVFIKDKNLAKAKYLNILVNLFVVGIIITTCFNQISELAFRMKWYFFWTESLLMVYLIQYASLKKLSIKYLLYVFIAVLYTLSLTSMLEEFASRGSYIFPYKTFLSF